MIPAMFKVLSYSLLAAMMVPALPRAAAAQVYPERIRAVERARVVSAAYQRRTRDDNREEQTERTTRTLKLGANGVLTLANIAGDIVVTRAGGSEVTVEIVKTARGKSVEDAREQIRLVQVEVTERSGRAEIRTRYPNNDGNNRRNFSTSVDYIVSAPAGTRVSIASISGTIKVTDLKGEVSANSVSGDVRLTGAGRVSEAKSISGTVEIVDAQVDGALDSSSVSGDVILRRVNARQLDASSVSGNVKFDDVQCDHVSANSISGTVALVGSLARNGRYELKSFSGDVHLYLSGGTGFEIDANSSSGEVRSDFDIVTRGSNTTRRGRRTVLTGTFGDGSAVLDLTTFSGSIIISKR